jgi:hypothetical protein
MTLMNMCIGVLCEVIATTAEVEKEAIRTVSAKEKILFLLTQSGYQATMDMRLTKDEFRRFMVNPVVVEVLRDIGVDPVGLIDFTDYIFGEELSADLGSEAGLTFEALIDLILNLGGTNKATVKDVVDMRKVVLQQLERIEDALGVTHANLHAKLETVDQAVKRDINNFKEFRETSATSYGSHSNWKYFATNYNQDLPAPSQDLPAPSGGTTDSAWKQKLDPVLDAYIYRETADKSARDSAPVQPSTSVPAKVNMSSGSTNQLATVEPEAKYVEDNSARELHGRFDKAEENLLQLKVHLESQVRFQVQQQTKQFQSDLAVVVTELQHGIQGISSAQPHQLSSTPPDGEMRNELRQHFKVVSDEFARLREERAKAEKSWQAQTRHIQEEFSSAMTEKQKDHQRIIQLLEENTILNQQLRVKEQDLRTMSSHFNSYPPLSDSQQLRGPAGPFCGRSCTS